MGINALVFDLDGTLVCSHDTIYSATLHSLKELGVNAEMPREKFMSMIGMHFEYIFAEFGFNVPDFEYFIGVYKRVYFDYINLSTLYDGAEELIIVLNEKKLKLGLLTTKGQDQAELILKHFNVYNRFDGIMGRRPGMAHKPSPEPLLKLCDEINADVSETVIIGDTELDIECGKNAGAYTCAVTYGYRTKEELRKTSPNFLIDNIADIKYIVSNEK
jgi:phosphoglycolate phosphatase-like HAD superfamily hydrolase